jgi:hypothetical protein
MSKSKKGSKENPITSLELSNILLKKRAFQITGATIKDDFCNYGIEKITGIGIGNTENVTGKAGTIKDSLRTAFSKLFVHLAIADGMFSNRGIEVERIEDFEMHEFTLLYEVVSFKVTGGSENESVILTGHKYVPDLGGRMELKTPKITIDNLGGYKWHQELAEAIAVVREEVALYEEGNYIPVKDEEDTPDPKQQKIDFEMHVAGSDEEGNTDSFEDFENAKV